MIARGPSWFSLLLLALLALLTWWLDQTIRGQATVASGTLDQPDFLVEGLQATYYGIDGKPRSELLAARMVHLPGRDTTHLEAPRFQQLEAGRPQLSVVSRQGDYDPATGEATFRGNVTILGNQQLEGRFEATTESLAVLPDAGIVRTDQPIVVRRPGMRVSATGMIANTNTHEVKLLSNVKGYYEQD